MPPAEVQQALDVPAERVPPGITQKWVKRLATLGDQDRRDEIRRRLRP